MKLWAIRSPPSRSSDSTLLDPFTWSGKAKPEKRALYAHHPAPARTTTRASRMIRSHGRESRVLGTRGSVYVDE
jgi:hypothetical protein